MKSEGEVQLLKVCIIRTFLATYSLILILSLPLVAIIIYTILVLSTGAEMKYWRENRPSAARRCWYIFIAGILFLLSILVGSFIAAILSMDWGTGKAFVYFLGAFSWILFGILCCGLEIKLKFPNIHQVSREAGENGAGGDGNPETTDGLRIG